MPNNDSESHLDTSKVSKMSHFASPNPKKNSDIIKEEIVDHIENQMRQLTDLKDYF